MIRSLISKQPLALSFGLLGVTWLAALIVWAQSTSNAFNAPSAYDLFPLLGLMAFGALWASYVVGAGTLYLDIDKKKVALFHKINASVIILLILLHPGLLINQLYQDGFGVPPASYAAYVSANYIWVVYLGVVSMLIFLVFELRHWFAAKNWWKWVLYANDAAMFFIFYHGLALGAELQSVWFQVLWWFYGATLVAAIAQLRYFSKRT